MLYRLASHTHTRKRVLSKLATTRKTAEHSERGYHLHNDDNGEGEKKEAKSTVEEEEEEKTTGFFFLLPLRHGTIERKISLSLFLPSRMHSNQEEEEDTYFVHNSLPLLLCVYNQRQKSAICRRQFSP